MYFRMCFASWHWLFFTFATFSYFHSKEVQYEQTAFPLAAAKVIGKILHRQFSHFTARPRLPGPITGNSTSWGRSSRNQSHPTYCHHGQGEQVV